MGALQSKRDFGESIPVSMDTLYYKELGKLREEMTGWDRVKAIFERDEVGDLSPQLTACWTNSLLALLGGAIFGGFGRARIVAENQLRSSAHEKFDTPLYAQKLLQDKVMLGFGDGAFRLGWRLCAFTFMYMTVSVCIAAYRDKAGVVEHAGGGATAGFLYKILEGPKPCVAGAVVGGSLGLGVGALQWVALKLIGKSPDDIVEWRYRNIMKELHEDKQRVKAKRFRDIGNEEIAGELIQFHETFFAEDDRSSSTVEATSIGMLKKEAEKGGFVEEMFPLMPKALEKDVKGKFAESQEQEEEAGKKISDVVVKSSANQEKDSQNKQEERKDAVSSQPKSGSKEKIEAVSTQR